MQIGSIGTGLMGLPMARRILNAGYPLTVYNRTAEKAEPLVEDGATLSTSAEKVLELADATVLMLTDAYAIRETILNDEARPHLRGHMIIQMGTIAPQESRDLAEEIAIADGEYLEAPVLGSIPQARTGELIVMVGSTEAQMQQWRSLLQCFGPEPQWIGEVGTAAALKLAMNQLIASLTSAFALSLGFVQRQGVDVEQFMSVLRASALYAPTFDKKLDRMVQRNFANPNFPSKHMLKDVSLFLQEVEAMGLGADALEGVQKLLQQTVIMGLADADYSALYSAVNPNVENSAME